jgi:hypothetical protein
MGTASAGMGRGCLVQVTTPSLDGDFVTIGYLVAEQNTDRAVGIIKSTVAKPTDKVVAVSRVSEELLHVLDVSPGEFKRVDGKLL